MKNTDCDKLILAVLQGEEYQDAIAELNQNGFYATVLQSRGGFLHCQSATILVGVHHTDLPQALALLKRYGERTVMQYQPLILGGHGTAAGCHGAPAGAMRRRDLVCAGCPAV